MVIWMFRHIVKEVGHECKFYGLVEVFVGCEFSANVSVSSPMVRLRRDPCAMNVASNRLPIW